MRFCSIASGSSGNCIYVGSDNTHVLVDIGISGKKMETGLNSLELTGRDLDGILITHEHSDHIKGLGVISRKYGIPIYATAGTVDAMVRTNALGKIPEGIFHEIQENEPFMINDLKVNPFTIPHDAAQPVGYRLDMRGILWELRRILENIMIILLRICRDWMRFFWKQIMIFVCCRWVNIHII